MALSNISVSHDCLLSFRTVILLTVFHYSAAHPCVFIVPPPLLDLVLVPVVTTQCPLIFLGVTFRGICYSARNSLQEPPASGQEHAPKCMSSIELAGLLPPCRNAFVHDFNKSSLQQTVTLVGMFGTTVHADIQYICRWAMPAEYDAQSDLEHSRPPIWNPFATQHIWSRALPPPDFPQN